MQTNEKEYLKSKEWQMKRIERLKLDDFKCCRCGSPHNLQIHHTNYSNLGNEDVYNDLITLCDNCHESIEKEIRSGYVHNKPINLGSNYGIKQVIKVPVKCGVIYNDMKDVDPTRQLQFRGGKIRLCKVHLSYNDFFNDMNSYKEFHEDSKTYEDKTYEDYQYEFNNKDWYVFVEQNEWVHPVLTNVMVDLEIRELQNGIIEIFLLSHASWESYSPLTKKEQDILVNLLDKCENYYHSLSV